ncbi:MAG: hypothetical protein MI923_08265, partial [Phycisphaerales bacterium]|nr:hypothetical protein [Phycisphaerales bacterium]
MSETVALVKKIYPFLENHIYRQYFTKFYEFSDAAKYKISTTSSGVSFTGLNPNIQFVPKNIDKIKVDGLHVDSYGLTMTVQHSQVFTICLVMSFWRNRKTNLISSVSGNNNLGTKLKYNKNTNIMSLITNRGSTDITIPSALVPEVFLDFSSRKRSRASREAATTSRESDEEREKNLWLPWPGISLSCRRQGQDLTLGR